MVAGLLLRVWFVQHAARIAGDSLVYGDIAKNLLEHGAYGFTQATGAPQPTLIRLPGYPLFLAGCFLLFGMEHYTAVMYVQCFFDLFTCLLVSGLALHLFGRRAALAALFLSVLCPFTASYVAAPLTETLTLTGLALTFYGLERWGVAGVVAVGLAGSILLRPEQGLLAAAVVPAMGWMALRGRGAEGSVRRRLLPVVAVACCSVLPLLPWTVRNWETFHVFQPLAPRYATDPGEMVPLGFQRWYRTWAIDFASTEDVYWNYDGAAIDMGDLPSRAFDSDAQYNRTEALLDEYDLSYNATAAFDRRFARLAQERVAASPIRYYVALPIARLINMAFRPRTEMLPVALEWWRWREHPGGSAVAAGMGLLNLGYFVLGGWGFWRLRREGFGGQEAVAWAMMGSIVLRCMLLATLDNSEPRYTLEFFPVLVVWAALLFRAGTPSPRT
jgi:hypothetical protein